MLKGRDIVVMAALVDEPAAPTVRQLADMLGLPSASVHRSFTALERAGVYFSRRGVVAKSLAFDILAVGMRFMFPPEYFGDGVGVPTAWSADPLASYFGDEGPSYVWPHPAGTARGTLLAPLDPVVPTAALARPRLGEILALADAIRIGGAREREVAGRLLAERLEVQPLAVPG